MWLFLSLLLCVGQSTTTPPATPGQVTPLPSVGSASDVGQYFTPGGSTPHTVMVFSTSPSDSEAEEMIAFDVQPGEGRLPDSSYTDEDSLFTWTDITGISLIAPSI